MTADELRIKLRWKQAPELAAYVLEQERDLSRECLSRKGYLVGKYVMAVVAVSDAAIAASHAFGVNYVESAAAAVVVSRFCKHRAEAAERTIVQTAANVAVALEVIDERRAQAIPSSSS